MSPDGEDALLGDAGKNHWWSFLKYTSMGSFPKSSQSPQLSGTGGKAVNDVSCSALLEQVTYMKKE